jgi:alpha-N-arabinofuranosidase
MQALSIAIFFYLSAGFATAQSVNLTVNTDTVLHSIDPKIYGQSVNRGIWGEAVRNRSFEQTLTQGVWKVKDGVLEAAGGTGDSQFRFGAETWRDYDLTIDALRPSGNAVLVIAVRSNRNAHYALSLGGAGGFELTRTTDTGAATVLQSTAGKLENGRWYKLRVKIDGTRLQVWIGGQMLFDVPATGGPPNGQAFVAVRGGPASFANLSVKFADGTPQFNGVPTAARYWYASGSGEVAMDANLPLNGGESLRIVSHDAGSGIEQPGFAVRAADALRGSLWLRGTGPGLIVRLLEGGKVLAQQTVSAPTADWTEFPLLLVSTTASANATLRMEAREHSDIQLDQVSLMADSSRANGGFRPDLTQAVAALHPPVLRWQAGNWKNGIGPQTKRIGDDAPFGIDEFLAFARRVGAEPLIVLPVDRAEYLQDALDLFAYCNGSPDNAWGKIRAQNGHPEPYRVKYWEIGNQVSNPSAPDCAEALGQLVPAMKNTDRAIRIIVGCSRQPGGANLLDFLDIPQSEYAAQSKSPRLFVSAWNAQNALDAATILNALERDPAVTIATPAHSLRHVNAASSGSALINFDQSSWFPSLDYVVMKLYRDHFAPDLLEISGDPGGISVNATRTADGDKIYLKLANPSGREVPVQIALRGDFPLLAASMQLVAADNPATGQPVESNIDRTGMTVRFRLPRASVAVITLSR